MTSNLMKRGPGIRGRLRATARLLAASMLASTLAVGGASTAMAATVTVTPATGGSAIMDVTGGSSGAWTPLGTITFQEDVAGQIGLGNVIVKAPAGFEFRQSAINVAQGGTNLFNRIYLSANLSSCSSIASSISVTPTASTIQFRVCETSGDNGYVQLSGLQVRPAARTPLPAATSTSTRRPRRACPPS